mgnify:CR=1 FL=1
MFWVVFLLFFTLAIAAAVFKELKVFWIYSTIAIIGAVFSITASAFGASGDPAGCIRGSNREAATLDELERFR